MSWSRHATLMKFVAFAVVGTALTAFLLAIFGQYRFGASDGYSAVFSDVSRLKGGDSVRFAGIRVGTVNDVSLRADKRVLVKFDADRDVVLRVGTRAAVRYLNLTGDRYLELVDNPGSDRIMPVGSQIPMDDTAPALDLDLLLGGLKPVIQGLNPQDVNALTASLMKAFQGQGETLQSLLTRTSSFTATLADNSTAIQQLIDNLNTVLATLNKKSGDFAATIDRLEGLVAGLSADRDPIGAAITSLDHGTASLADLLTAARRPLAGTVDQLNRLAPLLDQEKDRLDSALQRAPHNYHKLARFGAYGAFVQYYICGISLRVSDQQGATALFPWIKQTTGRCAEPDA
jgi:phospholipid/cholesterol/gamma-HCH transport system substrate-binding protein